MFDGELYVFILDCRISGTPLADSSEDTDYSTVSTVVRYFQYLKNKFTNIEVAHENCEVSFNFEKRLFLDKIMFKFLFFLKLS